MSILIVTGTGTDVGKTVATAALATCAKGRVAVVKPAQTGVGPGEPGDLAEVTRLSGVANVYEFARYPDPLSPHHAAYVSGLPELAFADTVRQVSDIDDEYDQVIVEGAGGLLVPFDSYERWTLVDLAHELDCAIMVVVQAGLGTLNHTALTVQRIEEESIDLAGIIVGSWPPEPDLVSRLNLSDLAAMAPKRALAGVLPAEMATMRDFRRQATAALAPQWGGTFDWPAFRNAARP